MDRPQHALCIWLTLDEQSFVIDFPDGQQITIPSTEHGRLLNMIRTQVPRPVKRLLTWQQNFASAFEKVSYEEAKARGQEIRAKEEARLEREKKARMKRVEKRDAQKEADAILELVGML